MRRAQNAAPSAENKRKTRNDMILAVVLLLAAAASFSWWHFSRADGASAAVLINGVETARYALSEDQEVIITTGDNNEYENIMVIENGKVTVREANCPDSICVKTRAASKAGETIVCLPHKLVIEILADPSDADLDMTA